MRFVWPVSARCELWAIDQASLAGGETGIRTLHALLESVSYGFYVVLGAIRPIRPADHCTLLHAGPFRFSEIYFFGGFRIPETEFKILIPVIAFIPEPWARGPDHL